MIEQTIFLNSSEELIRAQDNPLCLKIDQESSEELKRIPDNKNLAQFISQCGMIKDIRYDY